MRVKFYCGKCGSDQFSVWFNTNDKNHTLECSKCKTSTIQEDALHKRRVRKNVKKQPSQPKDQAEV